jgi:hypothetical protein
MILDGSTEEQEKWRVLKTANKWINIETHHQLKTAIIIIRHGIQNIYGSKTYNNSTKAAGPEVK